MADGKNEGFFKRYSYVAVWLTFLLLLIIAVISFLPS